MRNLLVLAALAWLSVVGQANAKGGRQCPGNQQETMSPSGKSEKREGPADVPSVVIGKLRFEVIPWGKLRCLDQNGGYIAAYDAATGRELWLLKVYTVKYDARKEQDTQDVFIESMAKTDDGRLKIQDENGRVYLVNPRKRRVEPR